jgi:predicted metalloprotease with PDZ domain
LGERIQTLHGAMAKFFGDDAGVYRVFMRQNPYAGTGGTALPQSFMFGYRPSDKPTIEALQSLLSHEMAHNWPAMQGEHGATAWYSEGTAEFYSMMLSYRAGVLSLDAFAKSLNDKTAAYYTNPYLRLSNAEAAKIFWSDTTAQTVPYGRGVIYLIATDAAIREKSGSKRSLDDVVKELYRREKAGQPYTIQTWLDLVGQELGAEPAKAAYEAMTRGDVLRPGDRFPNCLTITTKTYRVFELGFDRASFTDGRVVHGLKAGSTADQAGVRDGDQIVSEDGMIAARQDEANALKLTLKRDGVERKVSYVPRGGPVEGVAWVKAPGASPATCKF